MEYSNGFATIALSAVAVKLTYKSVRHWWNARSLRDLYIAKAADVQDEYETITLATDGDIVTDVEQELERGAKGKAVRHKGRFRHYLVQQGQAKFGCPTRNEANRLVVRKFLYEVCVEHGLIARHINDHLDIATELVFVPSRTQLTALAITHTNLSTLRAKVSDDLGGPRANIA